jgi:hypothetical protein
MKLCYLVATSSHSLSSLQSQTFFYTGGQQIFSISQNQIDQGYNTITITIYGAGAQDKIVSGNYYGMGGRGGSVKFLIYVIMSVYIRFNCLRFRCQRL